MVQFCDARKAADKRIISDRGTTGADPMFKAGEFAASEVSLAVKTSKFITQRTIAMTRRVQSEAPDVWDAWEHGDIDNDKVVRVNRALRRLVHDRSKELLNTLVVPVAIEKTPEILGRWLNQFIAEVEPDETDERLQYRGARRLRHQLQLQRLPVHCAAAGGAAAICGHLDHAGDAWDVAADQKRSCRRSRPASPPTTTRSIPTIALATSRSGTSTSRAISRAPCRPASATRAQRERTSTSCARRTATLTARSAFPACCRSSGNRRRASRSCTR